MTIAAVAALAATSVHAQRGAPESVGSFQTVRLPGMEFRAAIESKVIKGLPYSAEVISESIQTLADGNRIVQKTTGRVYRDNDGRVRREEDRAGGGRTITISDAVARRSYSLNEATKTAVEGPLPIAFTSFVSGSGEVATFVIGQEEQLKAEIAKVERAYEARVTAEAVGRGGRGAPLVDAEQKRTDAAEQKKAEAARLDLNKAAATARGLGANSREETTEERLQDRVIGGVLAAGTRRTTVIAVGAIGNEQPIKVVSEEWYSSDLQILVQTERTDPRLGRSTYQVTNINRNPPDSSLFQVPSDYTLRTRK